MLATVKFGVLFETRAEFLTILNTICDFKWTDNILKGFPV
jgi:hypothetical protein